MDMLRITARWTGFAGAPGYSNFFFAGGGGLIGDQNQVAQRVMSAFELVEPNLAAGVTINIEPEAAVVDSDTGVVSAFRPVDELPPVSAGLGGTYAGPVGAVVNWRTSDVRGGRRIRGRTFLVPLSVNSYDGDGTLGIDALANVRAFAAELVGGDLDSELGVWSRPVGGSGGVFATVDSYNVPDKVAVLRSRRD